MLTEDQKHYTGRAMLAMAAANSELMKAVSELMSHDVERAEQIASSAARNMEIAAAMLRLVPKTPAQAPARLFPQHEQFSTPSTATAL